MGILRRKETCLFLTLTIQIIFLSTAEIITRLTGKIGTNLPAMEGLSKTAG